MAGGNILCVFGTRPEAIKLAPVIRELRSHPQLRLTTCITGQHREMLEGVWKLFDIEPDIDLQIMRPGQSLNEMTAMILNRLGDVFAQSQPDCVLVQGDTTSVMATALAAFHARIPLAHLEAGLRTWDLQSPWPEEMNRRVTTLAAALHFCPTQAAAENLQREGVPPERITVTGNTVIDAFLDVRKRIETDGALRQECRKQFAFLDNQRKLILVTGHRRENFGDRLTAICRAVVRLSRRDDVQIVYPVHLNPNVQETVREILDGAANVTLMPPVDYPQFVFLLSRAAVVLTDSGGVQEEAPAAGKPVLVTRDTTERPEGVAAGTVKLVGADENRIVAEVSRLLDDAQAYAAMAKAINPYGDGRAASRVAQRLAEEFGS